MTNKEFFLKKFEGELPIFMRVFKAAGATHKSKHGYRHDPVSKTATELMSQTFALEGMALISIVKTGSVDFGLLFKKKLPTTIAAAAKSFEKDYKQTVKIISKMKDAEWEEGKAAMVSGKKVEWQTTKMEMMWSMLFDLVHHRGQLATYIRPMGGKVPSIYGPSADTKKN